MEYIGTECISIYMSGGGLAIYVEYYKAYYISMQCTRGHLLSLLSSD